MESTFGPGQQSTLEKFMLRARRVQSHSLIQKDKNFLSYAEGRIHVEFREGQTTIRQDLPNDEEVFESFATRVRVVTLGREPVHYKKVLTALSCVNLDAKPGAVNARFRHDFSVLDGLWEKIIHPSGDDIGYKVFMRRVTDPPHTESQATMQQLADSWMYADVAHTNVKQASTPGLDFPLEERYRAAVTYYSRIGRLVLHTATVVTYLHKSGLITLDEGCFTEPVSLSNTSNSDLD